ncbi:CvfB family protein [Clostridium oryzae]|uniref:S1 motif domain-containing protein n=1 Tax=Clostridium oryzae TaxID=1450648 RepID=A0A1V4IKW7_9CLOT|nr:S1-like domain-containing RNA-binding protein [Clostridium oryzae]OPJ60480.1 hypothetical protein CLORY_27890 [Clostridium oryzae]
MINIGKLNTLKVKRKTNFGYFLDGGTRNTSDDILLPLGSTLGNELEVDSLVEVFIYLDSKDRLIATMKKPLAYVGDVAYLKVVASTRIGSFIDIGLERDVFVPFKEKLYPLKDGFYYLFYLYVDKTKRIAATTNIDKYIDVTDDYKIGDKVTGTVYGFQTNNTAMIAVDNKYRGIILPNEYFSSLHEGDQLHLNVIKIYEDGKLGLTPRKTPKVERIELQDIILEYLKAHSGSMPFNDKSSPEDIYDAFHVSKNHFKNALGSLMKRNLISQDNNGTRLI